MYLFLKGQAGDTEGIDFSKIDLDEMKKYIEYSNICGTRPSYKVPFGHVPEFIVGVMVHPLAPDWYVDMVGMFCDKNDIPFEGKSKMYKID